MKSIFFLLTVLISVSLGQIEINKEKSTIYITGTSSLHDWKMTVEEFDIGGTIIETQINDLQVTITANSMKSGKSVMDSKAHDAVQAEEYQNIVFSAKSLSIIQENINGRGLVKIANESKEVDFSARITANENTEIRIQGETSLKMSDFKITPPTAMFGTLKTGDEVVISYDIFINK